MKKPLAIALATTILAITTLQSCSSKNPSPIYTQEQQEYQSKVNMPLIPNVLGYLTRIALSPAWTLVGAIAETKKHSGTTGAQEALKYSNAIVPNTLEEIFSITTPINEKRTLGNKGEFYKKIENTPLETIAGSIPSLILSPLQISIPTTAAKFFFNQKQDIKHSLIKEDDRYFH